MFEENKVIEGSWMAAVSSVLHRKLTPLANVRQLYKDVFIDQKESEEQERS